MIRLYICIYHSSFLKLYSESDTRSKFIDPKLYESGRKESHIVRERSFTDGRKLPGNKRANPLYVDYLLKIHGQSVAIIEAKKYDLHVTDWLEQVKNYGRKLWVQRVYTSNWQEIYEFDLESGTGQIVEHFPSPAQLYERYTDEYATTRQRILSIPYYREDGKSPRYYQDLAITRALSSIASGHDRVLLTLATGTGKTYIAFQIAYKLFQAKRSSWWFNRRPRILFLADRNILIDQAINTFNPLEKDIKQIKWSDIKKNLWRVPVAGNIFFSIYQALTSGSDEESDDASFWMEWSINEVKNPEYTKNLDSSDISQWETSSEWQWDVEKLGGYFRQYDPNFFDLIIIDECHRGGARSDGQWWEILSYFSHAVQIGMTATPKRSDNIDTYAYFWEPVYEYSLKEWINDGFLSPYKVKRIQTNIDELVIDSTVEVISWDQDQDLYELKDFNRKIVSPERIDLVARTILDLIKAQAKTIIFCVDQEHAASVRDAINTHKTSRDPDYCVRVTSNEWVIGRTYLERFQDNSKTIPTILTSSQMLTTWVDARNVRNIVLLRTIGSMTEFKQIIGRGTRLYEGKDYFTIIDFTWATNLFYDPARDGEQLEDLNDDTPIPSFWDEWDANKVEESINDDLDPLSDDTDTPKRQKLRVRLANDRELRIINIETRYIGDDGKPLSATEYLQSLVGKLPTLYQSEEQLRTLRADPQTRESLLAELKTIWLDTEQLADLQKLFDAADSDIFDVLTHLSYGEDLQTRAQRVTRVLTTGLLEQSSHLSASDFLEYLLRYYERYGSTELIQSKMGELLKLYGAGQHSITDIVSNLWGMETLMHMRKSVQAELFKE